MFDKGHISPYLPYILTGLSVIGGALGSAFIQWSTLVNRVTAIEVHQSDTTQRLDRIESKIDYIVGWTPPAKK